MGLLGFLISICFIGYIFVQCFKKLVPYGLTWFFKRKLGTEVYVGQVQLLSWTVQHLKLVQNGLTVEIEKLKLSSSFFSRDVSRPLMVSVLDFRLEKDLSLRPSSRVDSGTFENGDKTGRRTFDENEIGNTFSGLPSRIQVPQWILNCIQFMGFHAKSGQILLLNTPSRDSLLSLTYDSIEVTGVISSPQEGSLNVSFDGVQSRIYSHVPSRVNVAPFLQPSTSRLSFGLKGEVKFNTHHGLNILNLRCSVLGMTISVDDDWSSLFPSIPLPPSRNEKSFELNSPQAHGSPAIWALALLPANLDLRLDSLSISAALRSEVDPLQCNATEILVTTHVDDWRPVMELGVLESPNIKNTRSLPNMYLTITIEDITLATPCQPLVDIKTLHARVETLPAWELSATLMLKSLSFLYASSVLDAWVHFLRTALEKRLHSSESRKISTRKRDRWKSMKVLMLSIRREVRKVGVTFDVGNVSGAAISLSNRSYLGMGTSHASFSLSGTLDHGSTGGFDPFRWRGEMTANNIWSVMKEESSSLLLQSPRNPVAPRSPSFPLRPSEASLNLARHKIHYWDHPVSLGPIIIQFEYVDVPRCSVMLEAVRLEWSDRLGQCLADIHNSLGDILFLTSSRPSEDVPKIEKVEPPLWTRVRMEISSPAWNVFFRYKDDNCLLFRLDEISAHRGHRKFTIKAKGLSLSTFKVLNNASHTCQLSRDIPNPLWSLGEISFLYDAKPKTLRIEASGKSLMRWKPSLHLAVIHVLESIKKLRSQILSPPSDVVASLHASVDKVEMRRVLGWSIDIIGEAVVEAVVSETSTVSLATEDAKISFSGAGLSFSGSGTTPSCNLLLNGEKIMMATNFQVKMSPVDPELTEERKHWDELSSIENRTLKFTASTFRLRFPYKFNFSQVFMEEFIGTIKWVKRIHKHDSRPFKPNQRLPVDLWFQIGVFQAELPDDPFEVALRDNTILMMDEALEREKRNRALQSRIESLPESKLKEIFAALPERNAQLYIERSRKQRVLDPPRSHLFVWEMVGVEIIALADPNFHGETLVIEQLQDMDPESPWPEDLVPSSFSTLWCRCLKWDCTSMCFRLRDYPQKLCDFREFHLWGRLAGAEVSPSWRARRTCHVYVEEPWAPVEIERSMMPLKFFHDFSCDIDLFSIASGPCWEPALSQVSLAWEWISRPSLDPSPGLPYWDKMRLIYHGRLTLSCRSLTLLLHASLDPYNTTEEMALKWSNLVMDWTNAKFAFRGQLDVLVRTASKYDDCRLLHLPFVRLSVKLNWLTIGHPDDHYGVSPCAPERLPEYSSNQEHDSFRAFRSQAVSLCLSLETKPSSSHERQDLSVPCALFYASTFRWFENLKMILSGVPRPIRRGSLFTNVKPRKPALSRHYKNIQLSVSLHQFSICYWMSSTRQKGFELRTGRLTLSSEHVLTLVLVRDGLKHRPRAEWNISYLNADVGDLECWLLSSLAPTVAAECSSLSESSSEVSLATSESSSPMGHLPPDLPACEKWFFFSLRGVTYSREAAVLPGTAVSPSSSLELGSTAEETANSKKPAHRLVIHDLKGAWTKSTKDVAISLYDGFMKAQTLRKNLSRDALRPFFRDPPPLPHSHGLMESHVGGNKEDASSAPFASSPSAHIKGQGNDAASMLRSLLTDPEHPFVYTEDADPDQHKDERLLGVTGCLLNEVQSENWLVELVNPQVLLKGVETAGYIIGCAAKATIHQRLHYPVWKERALVSKTTWIGGLDGMQYYATVNVSSYGTHEVASETIRWLSKDNIEDTLPSKIISDLPDMPDLVGSGQSVGGVVSTMVGAGGTTEDGVQLQRMISRCRCQFYFASFGDTSLDPSELTELPPPMPDGFDSVWGSNTEPHDAFTLVHHDLEISTNALQYAMLLDIFNNLLFYTEPVRKEAAERLQRLRFESQLSSVEDQRKPILELQNEVRGLLRQLRSLDREMYTMTKGKSGRSVGLGLEETEYLNHLLGQSHRAKETLYSQSEELNLKLSIYKETQLKKAASSSTASSQWLQKGQVDYDQLSRPTRTAEICFTQAQWRLTEADGQIGISDLVLKNFLYKRITMQSDAVEHLAELGYVSMKNLMPNSVYVDVLKPTEWHSSLPVSRQRALRMFCREKPPVGGISIKDHFEINLCPVRIALEKQFVDKILNFLFPENESIARGEEHDDEPRSSGRGKKKKKDKGSKNKAGRKDSNFYVRMEDDPVEKMRERAEQNKLFVYIKVPEVQVRLSYKGLKEKNLRDVHDFSLTVPTLEYHNVTWSWLDFYRSVRSDARGELISQLLKQKFFGSSILTSKGGDSSSKDDTDKEEQARRLLLGALRM